MIRRKRVITNEVVWRYNNISMIYLISLIKKNNIFTISGTNCPIDGTNKYVSLRVVVTSIFAYKAIFKLFCKNQTILLSELCTALT